MKYDCDMIADLLPLYKDGVCSEASAKIINEHFAECQKCSGMLEKLNNNYIDEEIVKEKDEVISSQAKFFKRKSAIAGTIVATVFAIPILVCLIVNLATGAGLSWFFIVLAAMFIPTSLIVVPLMVSKYRMLCTMGAFTLSLELLLGIICLYTKGNWFLIPASASLFGLTICFAPFIVGRNPVKSMLKNYKGLAILGSYTIMYIFMMLCIGISIHSKYFFITAFAVSLPMLIVIWGMFFVIRYIPLNGFIKTSICIAIVTLFMYFTNVITDFLVINLGNDPSAVQVSSSMSPIELIVGFSIAGLFLIVGIIVKLVGGKK